MQPCAKLFERWSAVELKALRFAAGLFLGFGESELQAAVAAGVLVEVRCEQHH